jgi:hypothetical protein
MAFRVLLWVSSCEIEYIKLCIEVESNILSDCPNETSSLAQCISLGFDTCNPNGCCENTGGIPGDDDVQIDDIVITLSPTKKPVSGPTSAKSAQKAKSTKKF